MLGIKHTVDNIPYCVLYKCNYNINNNNNNNKSATAEDNDANATCNAPWLH